jgi:addiction module HigA family antidote
LARQIFVPANRINSIMAGKRNITADTALRLGKWFGMSPSFWLNLQKNYELRLAERSVGKDINKIETRNNHSIPA